MKNAMGEAQGFYNSGHLKGEWPANELLARVEALEEYRKSIPAKRKRTRRWLILSIIAAIVFYLLEDWQSYLLPGARFAGVLCTVAMYAAIISSIVAIVMLIRLYLRKCDGDAAAVLGPFLRCIGPDLAKGNPVKVNASLKPPAASDFLVKTGEKYVKGYYQDCVDRFFKREIVNLQCRLSDGTRLLAGITEHGVEKTLKKKNPRGKWKTKKRYRRKIAFRARLVLDESRSRLTGVFKLPPDTIVEVRKHPRGALVFLSLRKMFTETERLDAGPLLAALAGAYVAVTPAKPNEPISSGGVQ